MKKITIAILGIFLLPTYAFAAFNDVTLTTSTNISVGGYALNITGSSAVIQSIVINTSNFSVTLSSGSSIQVTSPTYQQLSVDVGTFTASNVCITNSSVLTLSSSGTSGTVTITPQATICSTPVSNGSGAVSNSGGPTAIGGTDYYWLNNNRATTTPVTPQPQTPTSTQGGVIGSGLIIKNITSSGRTSPDVRIIQRLLNSDPATQVSKIGAGSPGKETNYFGPATRIAVQKFQLKYGIVKSSRDQGYGVVGPKTRAKMNELLKKK